MVGKETTVYGILNSPSLPSLREERHDCDVVAIRVSYKNEYFCDIIELKFNVNASSNLPERKTIFCNAD